MPDEVRAARSVLWGALAGAIDERGAGLHCRANAYCTSVFHVKHDELTTAAAGRRDTHERDAHQYVHVVIQEPTWNFTARESGRGKKKPH